LVFCDVLVNHHFGNLKILMDVVANRNFFLSWRLQRWMDFDPLDFTPAPQANVHGKEITIPDGYGSSRIKEVHR
jgi:hypothetical protein